MMKIPFAILPALLVSACCTSLPDAPAKGALVLPVPLSSEAVEESATVWHDPARGRDLPAHIYRPARRNGALPVVIVSHGIGEDRDSYSYLGRALARNGFMAVHLTHAGTDRATLRRGYWKLYQATKDPRNWRDRTLDVRFALDRLAARPDADMSRVAVAGHSAGAFTAFSLVGLQGNQGRIPADARVGVIVAMSMPKIEGLNYDAVGVPVLNITGTCDSSIIYRTRPRDRRAPFDRTHATRQFLVTIDGVNHDEFSNPTGSHHALIVALTVDFLRAWLWNDPSARAWFDQPGRGRVGPERLVLERK